MAELGIVEYFAIGEAVALIATFFIIMYFSIREAQSVRVDIETKVLNDLDDKLHGMIESLVHKPALVRLLDKTDQAIKLLDKTDQAIEPEELVFAYYILYMCAYAFHMRQRKVLRDNEWEGWLRWMRSAFEFGTIGDYWEKAIDPKKWFDPAFQHFINNEIIKHGMTARGAK
jgi:hypothetical protein